MITTKKIKMLMSLHNVSKTELADQLGISTPTLRSRFEDGNWKFHEMMGIIRVFELERPQDVFFKRSRGAA